MNRLFLRRDTVLALLLAALTVAAFGPTCNNSYEFLNLDDPDFVYARHVRAGLSIQGVKWAFTTFDAYYWFPLTWLSFELDTTLFGTAPWGYHLTNVILHTCSVVVLFLVLRRMTGAVWRSAVVAAIFAIHPLRVESVVWIAERKDVLSTLFWMLTLAAYVWYAEKPRWPRYLLLLVTFTLGLMAKPMLVTLPCVLLLLDWWPLRRARSARRGATCQLEDGGLGPTFRPASLRVLFLEKVPLFAVAAVFSFVTLQASKSLVMPLEDYPMETRLCNVLISYIRFLAKMAWPTGLGAYYPHAQEPFPAWQVVSSAALLLSITALIVWNARRRPYLLVGWLWYLGTLVPVIGLVQLSTQAICYRFAYVPSVGILVVVCWGIAELADRWQGQGLVVCGTVLAALACLSATWIQERYWRNSIILWTHTLEVTGDDNEMAQEHLGLAWYRARDLYKAEDHIAAAVRAKPTYADAHYNLGLIRYEIGMVRSAPKKLEEARRSFEETLRLRPNDANGLTGMGLTLLALQRRPEALDYLTRATQTDPDNPAAANGMGDCLAALGRLDEAIGWYRRAVDLMPEHPVFQRNLDSAMHELTKGNGR